MQEMTKTVLLDPVGANMVPPIFHWGLKMSWKMKWEQGRVERRKLNQEDWMDEEWVNDSSDELVGKALMPTPSTLMPTPSTLMPTTARPTNNNIAIRFTQRSSLQVLHKEKSISEYVVRQLPRRITINKGKEGMAKAAKYTPAHMRRIGYQAMKTGLKKFRSSPYARIHWAKHQGSLIIWYRQHVDAAMKGRWKQYGM